MPAVDVWLAKSTVEWLSASVSRLELLVTFQTLLFIATQHDDGYAASRINASGRMLINGSVLSKGGLINLDMHPGSV
ncbi:hypothetical protein J4U56_25960, partial [Escherichia coli]